MNSQDEFDLTAFCSAIELRDAAAQLRCYASNARVHLTSLQDPTKLVRTLQGSDVEHWIRERCAHHQVTYNIVFHWLGPDQLMMIEERCVPDETSALSASTAHVHNGLISVQSIVLIGRP